MYQKLSKEEKAKLRTAYANTKKGKELSVRLNRLALEGIFCLFTFLITIVAIFVLTLPWWYWFFVGLTLLCGILFLVGQHSIRMKEYNKFLSFQNKNRKKQLTKIK